MLQAILVSIVAFLAAIDEYTFGASMMGRPLFTAPIVGLILGDFQAGIHPVNLLALKISVRF